MCTIANRYEENWQRLLYQFPVKSQRFKMRNSTTQKKSNNNKQITIKL